MSEGDKTPKKDTGDVFAEMAYYLIPLLILFYIFTYISAHIDFGRFITEVVFEGIIILIALAFFVLVISVSVFVFFSYKLSLLLGSARAGLQSKLAEPDGYFRNDRWERIAGYIESDHPNDWRIAILDADVILDEILEKAGYTGDTVADKLKQVEESDLTTLEFAWEAHKVRNRIVHDADFVLSRREAERVFELYRNVFEEFQFI